MPAVGELVRGARTADGRRAFGLGRAGDRAGSAATAEPSLSRRCGGPDRRPRAYCQASAAADVCGVLEYDPLMKSLREWSVPMTKETVIRAAEVVGLTTRKELVLGNLRVLPPGQWSVELRLPEAVSRADDIDIYFRDHRDNRWRRGVLGTLREEPSARGFGERRMSFVRASARHRRPCTQRRSKALAFGGLNVRRDDVR